jgi:hypothetical protein
MSAVHPTEARFAHVDAGAAHYESFYLKACHPHEPLGVWIRYTVHKRPGEPATGSVWFTLFDAAAADGPRAHKITVGGPRAVEGAWIGVGEATLGPGGALGALDGIEWEIAFASYELPLFHLPRAWMYGAPLPRTKLLSPQPAAEFEGSLSVAGRSIPVSGWRGMVGHNWGAQHAERWIWLHGVTLDGDWLDVAIGKLRLGPLTTPWVANGAVSLRGERHPVGGPGRRARVRETPSGCDFALTGKGLRVRGSVGAARKDFVGWVYADPDGSSEHHALNCSIADMRLRVERRGESPVEMVVEGGAAYELGLREGDHGVAIQPFRDG